MQKNKYNIAVIPGDGIGIEVMPEALKVLKVVSDKYGINLHFDHFDLGEKVFLIEFFAHLNQDNSDHLCLHLDSFLDCIWLRNI